MVDEMRVMLGMRLSLQVSEPWEFKNENGIRAVAGTVLRAERSSWLLELDEFILVDGVRSRSVLCRFRNEGSTVAEIVAGVAVPCSGICIPASHAAQASELDSSWWRGGGGGCWERFPDSK